MVHVRGSLLLVLGFVATPTCSSLLPPASLPRTASRSFHTRQARAPVLEYVALDVCVDSYFETLAYIYGVICQRAYGCVTHRVVRV